MLQEIRAGGFPVELLQYEALHNEDIREIKGQSKMDRGQRINVETAAEANFVQRGSSIGSSDEQAAFEEFMGESLKNYMAGRRVTMGEEELVPLLGGDAQSGQEFLNVTREDVNQNYDYRIVAEGMRKFRVCSDGPDGQPDTHDDICYEPLDED